MTRAAEFFAYARERQSALHKKRAGVRPHTDDPIIQKYKFCNVFREDDVTTQHLRKITEPMRGRPEVLLATILYRWFNRMTTGDAIFNKKLPLASEDKTAWRLLLDPDYLPSTGVEWLKQAVLLYCGEGPYVTGAYCIIGAPHMPKIDGILRCFQNVLEYEQPFNEFRLKWQDVAKCCLDNPGQVSMESVWDWFRRYPRSGDFMAYEIVTDLCYTDLLDRAPDRMTWANAGPGAIRGLNRIHGRNLNQQHPKSKTNEEMRKLLFHSQGSSFWPQRYRDGKPARIIGDIGEFTYFDDLWPDWDMRTVEHTLCEFDKYERIRLGEGSVKGVYRGG